MLIHPQNVIIWHIVEHKPRVSTKLPVRVIVSANCHIICILRYIITGNLTINFTSNFFHLDRKCNSRVIFVFDVDSHESCLWNFAYIKQPFHFCNMVLKHLLQHYFCNPFGYFFNFFMIFFKNNLIKRLHNVKNFFFCGISVEIWVDGSELLKCFGLRSLCQEPIEAWPRSTHCPALIHSFFELLLQLASLFVYLPRVLIF